jgi:hypothetical protein
MKLDPVYLLAARRSAWPRRAVLLAGIAFLCGTALGAAGASFLGMP